MRSRLRDFFGTQRTVFRKLYARKVCTLPDFCQRFSTLIPQRVHMRVFSCFLCLTIAACGGTTEPTARAPRLGTYTLTAIAPGGFPTAVVAASGDSTLTLSGGSVSLRSDNTYTYALSYQVKQNDVLRSSYTETTQGNWTMPNDTLVLLHSGAPVADSLHYISNVQLTALLQRREYDPWHSRPAPVAVEIQYNLQ